MDRLLNIPYPIIVEGKYDRLRLLSLCTATILTTDGFGIFKKHEKLSLIRQLSEKTKIIVLTEGSLVCMKTSPGSSERPALPDTCDKS